MKKRGPARYRKSIVKEMDEKFVQKYGFEDSYNRFERSINTMAKEGDVAEQLAIDYLKSKNLLSDNYSTNRVIALSSIKIEADIIDYGNKIIYETKSRRNGELAKKAVKQKWNVFMFDRIGSIYQDYEFHGIVVANYEQGPTVKGLTNFDVDKFNPELQRKSFEAHYERVEYLKNIKRSKGYDEFGNRIGYKNTKKNYVNKNN